MTNNHNNPECAQAQYSTECRPVWAFARLLERAHALGCTDPDHYLFPSFRYRKTKTTKTRGTGYDPAKPQKTWRTAWRSLRKETAKRAGDNAVKAP